MSEQDIRWKQRFSNFEKSLHFLEQTIQIPNLDFTQKAGLIQFFEISFELSWNVLKDYLAEQGLSDVHFPRDSIKKAFETGIITDGHSWLEALKNRNLTSHTYDEALADKVVDLIIRNYYPLLKQLYQRLKPEM
ncbi:nucleotidyltransferase substrate binding protein [Reichenbachiella sp. MALMAid0571]|uniref:nucleotidyltransferase substrate binding protein n=1 Tax=Reichenbachiella sp. MALMAid0571 TaxID=3143939 RepID=UPI0032DF20FB